MKKRIITAILALTMSLCSNVFASGLSETQEVGTGSDTNDTQNDDTHWDYSASIEYLKDKGIVAGYEDGSYREDDYVTVLEAVIMVMKASYTDEEIATMLEQAKLRHDTKGGTYYEAHKQEMNDSFRKLGGKYENYTAEEFWGYDYLALAWELGLADTNNRLYFFSEAYSETVPSEELMGFDQPLSRDEVAGLLYTMCNSLQQREIGTPKDADEYCIDLNDAYIRCQDSIKALVPNGIMENIHNGYFAPFNKVTRGQFMTYLSRCLDETKRLKSVEKPDIEKVYFTIINE